MKEINFAQYTKEFVDSKYQYRVIRNDNLYLNNTVLYTRFSQTLPKKYYNQFNLTITGA